MNIMGFRRHIKIEEIIVSLAEMNQIAYEHLPGKDMFSYIGACKELQTINLSLGRRLGHTSCIKNIVDKKMIRDSVYYIVVKTNEIEYRDYKKYLILSDDLGRRQFDGAIMDSPYLTVLIDQGQMFGKEARERVYNHFQSLVNQAKHCNFIFIG
jgi:hypothetical protein